MATIRERNGSYQIRVYAGRDVTGKQIEKVKTWKPEPTLNPKQIEKALDDIVYEFEKEVQTGGAIDGKIRFCEFANKWLEANSTHHSLSYRQRANQLLVRINEAIGHISLEKLQPHHIMDLNKNLSEPGIKKNSKRAKTDKLTGIMKERKLTKVALATMAGLGASTLKPACRGETISIETAEKISKALGIELKRLFTIVGENQTLSEKTVLHHHRLVSSILQSAVYWQVLKENVAKRVKPPKVNYKEAEYLDDNDAQNLVGCLGKEPIKWRAPVLLLLYSGMRRGELCGLQWDDIDFKNSLIHIKRASQYLGEGIGSFIKETKTASSKRVLKMPLYIFDVLQEYKNWQDVERLKVGDRQIDNGRLFTGENGNPICPDSINGFLIRLIEENNLPHFTPHSLRHTNISLMIAAGVPLQNVCARAGHANMITTSKQYAHVIRIVDEMASDAIGDILNPRNANKKIAQNRAII